MERKNVKLIKDYCYPCLTPTPFHFLHTHNPGRPIVASSARIQLCEWEKKFILCCFVYFPLFLFLSLSPSTQIIIQNLTTYSVYTVNVQAASLSAINPRRILLGLHSASRKVNVKKAIPPTSLTIHPSMWGRH